MTTYRLDALAAALQSTLDECQAQVDPQLAKRLSRVINSDRRGQPEFLNWECRLPSGEGGEPDVEILRLPWPRVSQAQTLVIAELSILLDCKMRKASRWGDSNQASLTAVPIRRGRSTNIDRHRITLSANNQAQETSVSIDGMSVEAFLAEPFSPEQAHQALAQKKRHDQAAAMILTILGLVAVVAFIILYP